MRLAWLPLALLAATPASALDVPSGQPVELQEVLLDRVGDEDWVRFRFITPQIAREGGSVTYEQAADDMIALCADFALPYIGENTLKADVIVIAFADRRTEFGVANADATQFIEAFRPNETTCDWEAL